MSRPPRPITTTSSTSQSTDPGGRDTVVTGPVWDMWPTVQTAIKQVQAGVYTAQDFGTFSFMSKGGATLAAFGAWEAKLPDDVKKLVDEKRQAILDGSFRVPVIESTPVSE